MKRLLVFATDTRKLKPAALKLRAQDCTVHICDATKFTPADLVTSYDAIVLLDESEMVRSVYEAYNARQDKEKQIQIIERFDFDPSEVDEKKAAELEGRPVWSEMTVKELLEYAMHEYGAKLLGNKAEIIAKVDQLWREKKRAEADSATDEVKSEG
jgi:hypothetical protein